MFGYGMSKGVDIDGNGFPDIAIGSPNIDTVYIYKSYPVIQPKCTIHPPDHQIQRTNSSFDFKVCCDFKSNSNVTIDFEVKTHATLKLDVALNRAHFDEKDVKKKRNKIIFSNSLKFCTSFSAKYTFFAEHVFDPINIELNYVVSNDFRDQIDSSESSATQSNQEMRL